MRLWLLRHAPPLCEGGLCYGASDVAADAAQTQAAATRFAAALPADVALVSSPLQRCVAMTHALERLRPDLAPARFDPRIAEMDFGDWEGRLWSALPRLELDAWSADFADTRCGTHGESVRTFMARVGAAWDDWCASGTQGAWVSHAGVMRAASLLARGVRVPQAAADWPSAPIAFGSWIALQASAPAP